MAASSIPSPLLCVFAVGVLLFANGETAPGRDIVVAFSNCDFEGMVEIRRSRRRCSHRHARRNPAVRTTFSRTLAGSLVKSAIRKMKSCVVEDVAIAPTRIRRSARVTASSPKNSPGPSVAHLEEGCHCLSLSHGAGWRLRLWSEWRRRHSHRLYGFLHRPIASSSHDHRIFVAVTVERENIIRIELFRRRFRRRRRRRR